MSRATGAERLIAASSGLGATEGEGPCRRPRGAAAASPSVSLLLRGPNIARVTSDDQAASSTHSSYVTMPHHSYSCQVELSDS
eukprot:6670438-Pyramimonas_sp.AAC.1